MAASATGKNLYIEAGEDGIGTIEWEWASPALGVAGKDSRTHFSSVRRTVRDDEGNAGRSFVVKVGDGEEEPWVGQLTEFCTLGPEETKKALPPPDAPATFCPMRCGIRWFYRVKDVREELTEMTEDELDELFPEPRELFFTDLISSPVLNAVDVIDDIAILKHTSKGCRAQKGTPEFEKTYFCNRYYWTSTDEELVAPEKSDLKPVGRFRSIALSELKSLLAKPSNARDGFWSARHRKRTVNKSTAPLRPARKLLSADDSQQPAVEEESTPDGAIMPLDLAMGSKEVDESEQRPQVKPMVIDEATNRSGPFENESAASEGSVPDVGISIPQELFDALSEGYPADTLSLREMLPEPVADAAIAALRSLSADSRQSLERYLPRLVSAISSKLDLQRRSHSDFFDVHVESVVESVLREHARGVL